MSFPAFRSIEARSSRFGVLIAPAVLRPPVGLSLQTGAGRSGIQGLPRSASRRTVMALWPCLIAVET